MHRLLQRSTILIGLLIVACAPTAPAGPGPAQPAPAVPAVEQKAEFGINNLYNTLDQQAQFGNNARRYDLYDALVLPNEQGEPQPAIATSWKLVDPKTWQFTIRTDMKWHDGTPLTADDVKFSYDRATDPAQKLSAASLLLTLDSTSVVDKSTVTLKTKDPDPIFLRRLGLVSIVPKVYIERVGATEFGVKPIGSGPFKLKEWVPGDHITLSAFDEHAFRKPILREVTIRQVPDVSARVAGLRTGTLDLINGVPVDQTDRLKADGFDLAVLTAGSTLGYVMDTVMNDQPTTAPTGDKRVRLAVNYAIDKDAIAKQIYKGITKPSGQPLQEASFGYNPNVKPYPYDPAKAKALLTEAGYPNGVKLVLETHIATPEAQPVALLVQQNLKDVGIDLDVQLLSDLAVWRDKLYDPTKQRAPLFFSSFSNSPAMDAELSLTWFWSKNAARNYNDPEFDRLYEASRTEMDSAKRLDLLQKAVARLHDEAPYLWLVEIPVVVAFAPKKIKGVVANVEQNEQRLDKLQKIG